MAEADWDDVTYIRKRQPKSGTLKTPQACWSYPKGSICPGVMSLGQQPSFFPGLARAHGFLSQALSSAQRQGIPIETEKKFAGGQNKQHSAAKNTAKLDRETEELHHETVPLDLAKLIQQARQAKGWTQKELATKVNEKQQVINEYEAGKAIPNQQILSKLERTLGVKLRGKDRGHALPTAKKE